jgi:transcriptional regulator with XRE-family HTH domain
MIDLINMKVERARKSMSQEKLADLVGIQKIQISRYETGMRTPRVETLIKIADALDISLDLLVGRER